MNRYFTLDKMKYGLKYTEDEFEKLYNSKEYYQLSLTNEEGNCLCINIDYLSTKYSNLKIQVEKLCVHEECKKQTLLSEVCGSLSVEGIHSSKKIIEKISKAETFESEKEQNIYNLIKAYEKINELEITKATIKEVYETLMNNINLGDNSLDGEFYRQGEVEIGSVAKGVNSRNVESKMNELIEFINMDITTLCLVDMSKTVSLFVRNSLIHYQLVYIHPYYDGNGRMARLVAQWHSNKVSDVFNYIPISEIISYDKNNYYEAIQNVRESYQSMDVTYFVDYMLDKIILYVNTELLLREIIQALQNNLEVLTETEKSYIKIIYLSGLCNGKFGYKDFNSKLKISDEEKTKQGIFKILNNFVSKGVLNEYTAKDNKTKLYEVVFNFEELL